MILEALWRLLPRTRDKDSLRAIQLDPTLALRGDNLSRPYLQRLDFDEPIAEYSNMIERSVWIDAKLAPIYNNRGTAYYYKKDFDQAIADYTKALELDHDLAVAYTNRGLAYYKKSNFRRAAADFKLAWELREALPDGGARVKRALEIVQKLTE